MVGRVSVDKVVLTGSVGVIVIFTSLSTALALNLTGAEFTWLGLSIETPNVGLHDVNSGALRGHTILMGVPAALLVIQLGQVDTGGAGAGNLADIDIEIE